MFDIGLTNRLHASTDGPPCYAGTLVLGDEVERIACTAGAWTARDYRRQWVATARRLATGPRARTAFVIAVGRANRVIDWWPAYRGGRRVVDDLASSLRRYGAATAAGLVPAAGRARTRRPIGVGTLTACW